jgi:hypothetical protein
MERIAVPYRTVSAVRTAVVAKGMNAHRVASVGDPRLEWCQKAQSGVQIDLCPNAAPGLSVETSEDLAKEKDGKCIK